MDQGKPQFHLPLDTKKHLNLVKALNLDEDDLHPTLFLQVVSTGLPYLIVPVKCALDKVRIVTHDFSQMLQEVGAKFAYILHVDEMEGRTWDNEGRVEDIATGSAAGPVGAYLVKHRIKEPEKEMTIHQGRFVGRPSQIMVKVEGNPASVKVSGEVCMVAKGSFDPIEL